jgi:hypothetical protein
VLQRSHTEPLVSFTVRPRRIHSRDELYVESIAACVAYLRVHSRGVLSARARSMRSPSTRTGLSWCISDFNLSLVDAVEPVLNTDGVRCDDA